MDRLFDDFFGVDAGPPRRLQRRSGPRAVDIREDADNYIVEAELPGMNKEEIEIELENNVLSIKGERKFERKQDSENYHFVERSYGTFYRSFSLPKNVDGENITAEYKDGRAACRHPQEGRGEAEEGRDQAAVGTGRASARQRASPGSVALLQPASQGRLPARSQRSQARLSELSYIKGHCSSWSRITPNAGSRSRTSATAGEVRRQRRVTRPRCASSLPAVPMPAAASESAPQMAPAQDWQAKARNTSIWRSARKPSCATTASACSRTLRMRGASPWRGCSTDLFPALDGLAQAAHTYRDKPDGEDPLLDGVRRTVKALENALGKHGVAKINTAPVPVRSPLAPGAERRGQRGGDARTPWPRCTWKATAWVM